MSRFSILLLLPALAGCYTGPARKAFLQQEGYVRLDTVPGPGYDLTVEISALAGSIGILRPGDPADRRASALEFVAGRCAGPEIVREDVIEPGGPKTYLLRIRCAKA